VSVRIVDRLHAGTKDSTIIFNQRLTHHFEWTKSRWRHSKHVNEERVEWTIIVTGNGTVNA
jgi:hypothetical protein